MIIKKHYSSLFTAYLSTKNEQSVINYPIPFSTLPEGEGEKKQETKTVAIKTWSSSFLKTNKLQLPVVYRKN